MATLLPVRANGDGTLGLVSWVGGDGTAWSCIDNGDPAVGQPDTGYIYNQGSTTVDAHFLLADFPSDLVKVDSLVIETFTVPVGRADDNITMQVSVMAADEITRLAGNADGSAGVIVSGAANPSGYHVSNLFLTAAGVSANQATWNGARLRVNWVYTASMSKDPYDLRLHAIQLEGTYTAGAVVASGTGAGTTAPATGSGSAASKAAGTGDGTATPATGSGSGTTVGSPPPAGPVLTVTRSDDYNRPDAADVLTNAPVPWQTAAGGRPGIVGNEASGTTTTASTIRANISIGTGTSVWARHRVTSMGATSSTQHGPMVYFDPTANTGYMFMLDRPTFSTLAVRLRKQVANVRSDLTANVTVTETFPMTIEVRAEPGGIVTGWLNGVKVAEAVDPSPLPATDRTGYYYVRAQTFDDFEAGTFAVGATAGTGTGAGATAPATGVGSATSRATGTGDGTTAPATGAGSATTSTPGPQFWSDPFTRADGPLGPDYATVGTGPMQVGTNALVGGTTASAARYIGTTSTDDQVSQITYRSGTFFGVSVQMGSFANASTVAAAAPFYVFRQLGTTGGVIIGVKDAGAATFAVLAADTTRNLVNGDVIRLEYLAGVLTAKINGTTVLTHTPATPITGQRHVGFAHGSTVSAGVVIGDDWSGGDLTAGPTATTGTGSGTTTPATGAGSATSRATGTGSRTTTPATGSGAATSRSTGTGSRTTAPATGTGAATSRATGTGAGTTTPATGAGAATSRATGTGAGTTTPTTGAGGTGPQVTSGAGAGTTAPTTGSGAATSRATGTGSRTTTAATGSGAATSRATGTGAGTTTPATGSGTAGTVQPKTTGSGAGTTTPVTGSGAATSRATGTGSRTAAPATGSGSATSTAAGTGDRTLAPAGGAGAATSTASGTGEGEPGAVTGDGTSTSLTTGTGAGSVDPVTGKSLITARDSSFTAVVEGATWSAAIETESWSANVEPSSWAAIVEAT